MSIETLGLGLIIVCLSYKWGTWFSVLCFVGTLIYGLANGMI